jgi:hypothetical protein
LATIDPGEWTGYALFDGVSLVTCGVMGKGLEKIQPEVHRFVMNCWPDHAVIEIPQVYRQRQQKGDPNDLIQLALIAGMCMGEFLQGGATVETRLPREWKGQRSKEVDNRSVLKLLTDDERDIVARSRLPKYKLHNMIDAIGIGLWHVGRK